MKIKKGRPAAAASVKAGRADEAVRGLALATERAAALGQHDGVEVFPEFFASATLHKDGSIKGLQRRARPRAPLVFPGASAKPGWPAAAGSEAVSFEVDHALLAAGAARDRPPHSLSFRVGAVSGGRLQKWDGIGWEPVVAEATTVARDDRLRWMPQAAAGTLSAFEVQTFAPATFPPAPGLPGRVFFITRRGADGQVENVIARGEDAGEPLQVASELRESREELRRLSGLLVSIQEDERRRIALDLHDGLGQTLSLIKLGMEQAATMLAAGSADAAGAALRQLAPRVSDALAEVRRVSSELRPLILDDLGLMATLSWFFREFRLVSPQIEVVTALAVGEREVPVRLHITIFRMIQEAFHNIVKHAAASRVQVGIERREGRLHLMIEDNGCGFDPDSIKCIDCQARGLGLLSMKERASFTGGTYHLRSAGGQGTCIWASWPVDGD